MKYLHTVDKTSFALIHEVEIERVETQESEDGILSIDAFTIVMGPDRPGREYDEDDDDDDDGVLLVETSKCWKWRSFTKVIIPIPIRHNSSYDEFVASVMQSGDLDWASNHVMISYVIHSREKVNPTIINSDVHVMTYIMDADANGFRPILRINVVERSFEGPLNSSAPPPLRPTVDDDLNDYENDVDDTINMEDYSMYMEDFSSTHKMMKKTVK
ncbi:hypothetical protein FXO38_34171 [Capsicum annuum]|nr:hypothetical protein FXO38_34171 [Capsicum annuum]